MRPPSLAYHPPAIQPPVERDTRFYTRSHQRNIAGAFARQEFDRFFDVTHRQGGKDDCAFNVVTQHLVQMDAAGDIGNYAYYFPEFEHGKRNLWDKVCAHNIRLIEHVPEAARAGGHWLNEASMQFWLRGGTSLQVLGARFPNKSRGASYRGVVISEASRCNPGILDVLSPMFEVNAGWLWLNTTPNGKNHAFKLWQRIQADPRWFKQLLTVEHTLRDAKGEKRFGEPIIGAAELASERARGMTEEWIAQEYFCSWVAPMDGSIHGRLMERARADKRIGNVPWEPALKVCTGWDLGNTAVWFAQVTGREVLLIDYVFVGGQTFQEIVPLLFQGHRAHYIYDTHYFPADMNITDYTAQDGRTRLDLAKSLLGEHRVHAPKRQSGIQERINAAQWVIAHCRMDERKCEKGIEALDGYHREYDEQRQDFKPNPEKDWASHGADALGELGLHIQQDFGKAKAPPRADLDGPSGRGGWMH